MRFETEGAASIAVEKMKEDNDGKISINGEEVEHRVLDGWFLIVTFLALYFKLICHHPTLPADTLHFNESYMWCHLPESCVLFLGSSDYNNGKVLI